MANQSVIRSRSDKRARYIQQMLPDPWRSREEVANRQKNEIIIFAIVLDQLLFYLTYRCINLPPGALIISADYRYLVPFAARNGGQQVMFSAASVTL